MEQQLDKLLKERKKLLREMSSIRNSGASCSGARIRLIGIEKELKAFFDKKEIEEIEKKIDYLPKKS